MSCKNCFNGCASITSDKCVKYTGVSIPALGIDKGDSLFVVENNILQHLLNLIDGTGIIVKIPEEALCAVIESYLPTSGDISIDQYITALIQSVCFLQAEVDATDARVNKIEANYTKGCLTGIDADDGTHAFLQATIDFLCTLNTTVVALSLNLASNYTTTADLPALIETLVAEEPETSLYKNKMIPMTVMEYYGSTGNFDGSGAGIGDYIDIYLCNGDNGTPDKRGRVGVGATTGMGGGAMAPAVDPGVSGNPGYTLLSAEGANTVALSISQMPTHTHTASATSEGDHVHAYGTGYVRTDDDEPGNDEEAVRHSGSDEHNRASTTSTLGNGAHGHTITVDAVGDGDSHDNIQPVLTCYYIMYIPS